MAYKKVQLLSALFSVIFSLIFLNFHYKTQKQLSATAIKYIQAKNLISPNSIILPLNYSDNWLHSNISDYLGAHHNYLTLDNYEVNQGHFPLLYKQGMNPELYIGNFPASNKPCVNLSAIIPSINKKVDYVITLNQPKETQDSCILKTKANLNTYFSEVDFPDDDFKIYKRK